MKPDCQNEAVHAVTQRSIRRMQVCTAVGEDEALTWANERYSVSFLCCRFGVWRKETMRGLDAEPCRTHIDRTHYIFKR